jgi:hypothetical protein
VHSIWEGTTNVLSLDVLRAIAKTNGQVLVAFRESVLALLTNARGRLEKRKLGDCREHVLRAVDETAVALSKASPEQVTAAARDLTFSLATIYSGKGTTLRRI